MPFPACFVRPYFAIIPNVLQYSDCTPVLRLYSGTPNGLQYSKANSELCLGDRNFVRVIHQAGVFVDSFGVQNAFGVSRYPLDLPADCKLSSESAKR